MVQYASPNISETKRCLDFVPGIDDDTSTTFRIYIFISYGQIKLLYGPFQCICFPQTESIYRHHMISELWDGITYPFPKIQCLHGKGSISTPQTLQGIRLLIHDEINVNTY